MLSLPVLALVVSTAMADQSHVVPALHCNAVSGSAGYANGNIYNSGTSTANVNCPMDQLVSAGTIDPDTAYAYVVDPSTKGDIKCTVWSAQIKAGSSGVSSSYYSTSYSGSSSGASTTLQVIPISITGTAELYEVDSTWGSVQFLACSLPAYSTSGRYATVMSYAWDEIGS